MTALRIYDLHDPLVEPSPLPQLWKGREGRREGRGDREGREWDEEEAGRGGSGMRRRKGR